MLAITVFKKLYNHLIGYNNTSRFAKINKNQKTVGILLNFQYWHHKVVPICKLSVTSWKPINDNEILH